jgi:predicted AlkP superfamily pyrophosphatase or phosphodiesterase
MTWCRLQRPGEQNDPHTMAAAIAYILAEQPDYIVIYLGDVDVFGHIYGWMSPEYIQAIEANDSEIGSLLQALASGDLAHRYHLMILSDHGGLDHNHGGDSPEEMTIIWMLKGPSVKVNHEVRSPFSLIDIAPTVAQLLQLPPPESWQGQPIRDAFL